MNNINTNINNQINPHMDLNLNIINNQNRMTNQHLINNISQNPMINYDDATKLIDIAIISIFFCKSKLYVTIDVPKFFSVKNITFQ